MFPLLLKVFKMLAARQAGNDPLLVRNIELTEKSLISLFPSCLHVECVVGICNEEVGSR